MTKIGILGHSLIWMLGFYLARQKLLPPDLNLMFSNWEQYLTVNWPWTVGITFLVFILAHLRDRSFKKAKRARRAEHDGESRPFYESNQPEAGDSSHEAPPPPMRSKSVSKAEAFFGTLDLSTDNGLRPKKRKAK